jgi:hypothetical protein
MHCIDEDSWLGVSLKTPELGIIGSALSKLVLAAATLLGVGFVVINVPIITLLINRFSQVPITSTQNVSTLTGLTLFMIASVLLMVFGCFVIIGGLQYYRGGASKGVLFLGSLLASFYLLCLGLGSALISGISLSTMLFIVGPVLVMVSVAVYMGRLVSFKLVGSILGIVGGVLLAGAIFNQQPFSLVFDWGVQFSGPFMSIASLDAIVVVLCPIAAFTYAIFAEHKEEPIAHSFISVIALIYGLGMFVGSQALALNFLNLLWKAPWVGPFYGVPQWIFGTVAFWSASLLFLMIGSIVLVVCSFMGFIFAAQEFAQL